jgi:hypothetical protein
VAAPPGFAVGLVLLAVMAVWMVIAVAIAVWSTIKVRRTIRRESEVTAAGREVDAET